MEGVKTWLSSQVADFFDTSIKNLCPNMTSLNSCSDYVENELKCVRIFLYIIHFFLIVFLLTAHQKLFSDHISPRDSLHMYFCSHVRALSMSSAVKRFGSAEVFLFIYGLL
jgi:hypothetical protein